MFPSRCMPRERAARITSSALVPRHVAHADGDVADTSSEVTMLTLPHLGEQPQDVVNVSVAEVDVDAAPHLLLLPPAGADLHRHGAQEPRRAGLVGAHHGLVARDGSRGRSPRRGVFLTAGVLLRPRVARGREHDQRREERPHDAQSDA
jgi:hypothetical protein